MCSLHSNVIAQVTEEQNGIDFFVGPWDMVLEWASFAKRPIMVYLHKTYDAQDCRFMEQEVFAKDEVVAFQNKHFINAKINLHDASGVGIDWKMQYQLNNNCVQLLYFTENGQLLLKKSGRQMSQNFLTHSREALRKYERKQMAIKTVAQEKPIKKLPNEVQILLQMRKQYNTQAHTADFLKAYATLLRKYNYNHYEYERVVDEFLSDVNINKASIDDLQFIWDFADDIYSKAFKIVVNESKAMRRGYTKEAIEQKIKQTIKGAVKAAAIQQNYSMYKRAILEIEFAPISDKKEFEAELLEIYEGYHKH